MKTTYKKFFCKDIIMLVILWVLLYSCERTINISEENNKQFYEQKATDDGEVNMDKLFSEDSIEKFRLDDRNENIMEWDGTGFIPEDSPNGIEGSAPPVLRDMGVRYGTLLYKYDGYWSMRFGENYELDNRNKDTHPLGEGTGWKGTSFGSKGSI